MTDEELLVEFENGSLPSEEWTHRAHVRVAFLYASRLSLPDAAERMRASIQAYAKANNRPDTLEKGFHETVTRAFMTVIYAANLLTGRHGSSEEFCRAHSDLLDKSTLQRYYSQGRIMTMQAKKTFVEPDLAPLPRIVDDSLVILDAASSGQMDTARELLSEFARSLDFDLGFQNFDEELRELPGAYAPPEGRLLMAWKNKNPAGCVALRPLEGGACEMKRLWVRPEFRGGKLGRILAEAIIDDARRIGYAAIRLDTVPSMQAAIPLYRSLGFVDTKPYTENPIPGALFMELRLRDDE